MTMRLCPQCHSVFTEDYVFCLNDGAMLIDNDAEQETVISKKVSGPLGFETEAFVVCVGCGLENRAHSKFCKKCGSTLQDAPPPTPPAFSGFPLPTQFPAPSPDPPGETIAFQPQQFNAPQFNPPSGAALNQERSNAGIIVAVGAVVLVIIAILGFALYRGDNAAANSNSSTTSNKKDGEKASSKKSESVSLPNSFERSYRGTIGSQSFSMSLTRNIGDLRGTASTRKTDSVYGSIEDNGSFELKGYENDNSFTGIYRGKFNADGSIEGTWTTPTGSRPTSFYLSEE